jgi:hydroxyacylglutathione hydrolase
MQVSKITNKTYDSNTYVISHHSEKLIWLIDATDSDGILSFCMDTYSIAGAFITHGHFDHILALNALVEKVAGFTVYISEQSYFALFSEKLNLSFYHDSPITFKGSNIKIINHNSRIELFSGYFLKVVETPGHNSGCLSYKIDKYLFTGDSFIPGVKVVTKLKGGNREDNLHTINKIKNLSGPDTIICPGHGEMVLNPGPNGYADLNQTLH